MDYKKLWEGFELICDIVFCIFLFALFIGAALNGTKNQDPVSMCWAIIILMTIDFVYRERKARSNV